MARSSGMQGQATMGISARIAMGWKEYSRPIFIPDLNPGLGSAIKSIRQSEVWEAYAKTPAARAFFPTATIATSLPMACSHHQGLETHGKQCVCFSASKPCGHGFSGREVMS